MEKKTLLAFIMSKQFAKMLLYSVLITMLFVLSIFLMLRIYTDHGQALAVPDLRGMSGEELELTIKKRDLRFEIIDSAYVRGEPGGIVVDQIPEPGAKVKEGRLIFITINAYGREKVVMPNVKGVSFRQARAIIENKGLELGHISYVPDIALNNVLEQKINGLSVRAGDTVVKGEKVDLVLGGGLSQTRTNAPNLTGLNLEQAKNKLAEFSLNIGGTVTDMSQDETDETVEPFIYKQIPGAGSGVMLKLGELVDVFFTRDSTKLPGYNERKILEDEQDEEEDLTPYFN